MRGIRQPPRIDLVPQDVGDMGGRYQGHSSPLQLAQESLLIPTSIRQGRDLQRVARAPGKQIGMMLPLGNQYAAPAGITTGDEVAGLSGIARENNLMLFGANKPSHLSARSLKEFRGFIAQPMDRTVNVGGMVFQSL